MLQFVADLGEFHRLHAAYNSSTVMEVSRFLGATSVYSATFMAEEHPLQYALEAAGIPCTMLAEDASQAQHDQFKMFEYLNQYAQGKKLLQQKQQLDRELLQVLQQPLDARTVHAPSTLQAMQAYHQQVGQLLEEGPATAYRQQRLNALASRLQGMQTGVVIAPLDDIPDLLEKVPGSQVAPLEGFAAGEASRLRALVDRAALINEDDDLDALVQNLLREEGDLLTPKPELHYTAANIYFAVGDLESARSVLFDAAHALTDQPRYLSGLVLARLGQVRDALGDRENAVRAYQAVQALQYAPEVARQTAEQGLEMPFSLDWMPEQQRQEKQGQMEE